MNNDTVENKTKFEELVSLFELLGKIDVSNVAKKTAEKSEKISKFFKGWRKRGTDLSTPNPNPNLFPIIRLLLPDCDRRNYQMKEAKLASHLIKAFSIAETSDDALSLKNYKAPSSVKAEGDFGTVAYHALNKRCIQSTLSIKELNDYLDKISLNNSKGKEGQAEIIKSFSHLCQNLSADQLKWLLRIILKDLKISITDKMVFDAFHADANDLYKVNSSLEDVCTKLIDPSIRLNEVGVQIFEACCPMLGEKIKPSFIEAKMNKRMFYIELKLDGERFHLHKSGNKYVYYSRNRKDTYSQAFNLTLTPYIHNQFFNDHVENVILDGEMCFYDAKNEMYLSMAADQYDIKSEKEYENLTRCFCVFDILLLNDVVLTNKPLRERIQYLDKCFTSLEGRIKMLERKDANTERQVIDALNDAIDKRQEGIVVKDPESVYKPDQRAGSGWFKCKPDYVLGLNDDLDLLIVGGYYGSGKRGGILSHFLLAVAVPDQNMNCDNQKANDDDNATAENNEDEYYFDCDESKIEEKKPVVYPKKFYSFCKIGSGYTYKGKLF